MRHGDIRRYNWLVIIQASLITSVESVLLPIKGWVYLWPCRIVRLVLVVLLIYGGVAKLFDPKALIAPVDSI